MNVDVTVCNTNRKRTLKNIWTTAMCNELPKFMIKKDLLFPRLTKYGDTPEMYVAWKSSLKNVLSELGISPRGEVNLLVKWFGPNSLYQDLKSGRQTLNIPHSAYRK